MKVKGFTLVESILVIAIILILLGMINLSIGSIFALEKDKRIENELALILAASKSYHLAFSDDMKITQEKLVEKHFLSKVIAGHGEYDYKINFKQDKICVVLISKASIYEFKDGRYAEVF